VRRFYRGRHRKPTHTKRQAAALAVAGATVAVPLTPGFAHADGRWDAIIACESSGSPTAQNPTSTASGLFQFIDGTWRAYGGTEFAPRAKLATPDEQHIVANRAYAAEGYRPWNASKHCWGGKVDGSDYDSPDESVEGEQAAPQPAPEPSGGSYTVRPGDTLTNIAALHAVEGGWRALHERNREVIGDPNLIYPGQQLDL
jgi:hypothetical protein